MPLGNVTQMTDAERARVAAWIDAVDKVLSAKKPLTRVYEQTIAKRRDMIQSELRRLQTDEDLIAKMMREGY